MIPSYFDSPAMLDRLRAAAAALLGTPFFANSEAPGPGGGIDCVHTLNFLYRFCGAIVHLAIPRQDMEHGQHSDRSLLIEAFDTWPELAPRFTCIWRSSDSPLSHPFHLQAGDALCFLAGRVPHHGGVLLEHGDFLHTLQRDGCHTMRLDAVFRGWSVLGRLAAVYRPLPR